MKPLRYAVIGTGGMAHEHVRQFLSHPNVVVAGLSDPHPAALARFAERHPDAVAHPDPAEMLRAAQPDAVSIVTPNKFHHDLALLCLQAGTHVACEKPMALTVAEARAMESARQQSGRFGLINFSYRHHASLRFLRDLVAHGELGRLTRVNVVYLQSFLGAEAVPHAWRNDADLAGFGALGDLGAHMVDATRFVTGLEFRRVVGLTQTLIPEKRDASGAMRPVTTDTNAAFLAELTGSVVGTFETTQVAPGYGNHFQVEVSGTRGTAVWNSNDERSLRVAAGETFSRYETWTTTLPAVTVPTGFVNAQRAPSPGVLVDLIRGADVEYPSFADGVRVQEVLEGIHRSAATGAWVTL
jgi:predicted dehydrogenase